MLYIYIYRLDGRQISVNLQLNFLFDDTKNIFKIPQSLYLDCQLTITEEVGEKS